MKINLCDIGLVKDFLDISSKTQATKEKVNQTSRKLKTCTAQMPSRKMEMGLVL